MSIKNSAQTFALHQALGYLEKNPEENLPKLMAWVPLRRRRLGELPDPTRGVP